MRRTPRTAPTACSCRTRCRWATASRSSAERAGRRSRPAPSRRQGWDISGLDFSDDNFVGGDQLPLPGDRLAQSPRLLGHLVPRSEHHRAPVQRRDARGIGLPDPQSRPHLRDRRELRLRLQVSPAAMPGWRRSGSAPISRTASSRTSSRRRRSPPCPPTSGRRSPRAAHSSSCSSATSTSSATKGSKWRSASASARASRWAATTPTSRASAPARRRCPWTTSTRTR